MKDLQAVFIRDIAILNQINFIAVLRIELDSTDGVSGVTVNGIDTKFIRQFGGKVLYARIPSGASQLSVSNVSIKRDYISDTGTQTVTETLDLGSSILDYLTSADPLSDENPAQVSFYGGILQVRGDDFSKAYKVKVNGTDVPFTIVSKTEIMCGIPDIAPGIDQVDVITTSKTISRRTYFEYMVGNDVQAVMGTQKLVQQYVKLLMTTKGTDIFFPGRGGDLQTFVGTNFAANNATTVIAQVTLKAVQAGLEMTMIQSAAGIPEDERLSTVQVLGMETDPADPTIMQISLRLNTFGGASAQFSTILGGVLDRAADMGLDRATSY